ncbi:ArsC family (seleno)protein [Limnoglobus roseus]|uniref:Regulatory protein Spx n=1 Tax=Limnoglobus roseus TaxID=2598579 RepID=A0A5C1AUM8_9BACT|nr:ArsC family (seleno)protein [Limnoglobus roseus]QEL20954.1 Regulatory protein Spx [Limnoglobus roseus]
MAKQIDWLYHRNSCTTCKRAQAYLVPAGVTAATVVNATKERIDAKKALQHLAGVEKLIAVKGKRIETLDLKHDRPDDDAILALIMGPTGNLRAPTAKVGTTMVVGFTDDAYRQVFG